MLQWPIKLNLALAKASGKFFLNAGLILLTALIGAGCSTAGYRAASDEDAYRILQEKQMAALGHTNGFNIDTPYSDRKLDEIRAPEIILDRQGTNKMVLTLSQALEVYFSTSPSYKTQKEQLYLSALSLNTTRNNLKTLRVVPTASAGSTFTRNFSVNTVRNAAGQAIGTQVVGTETASVSGNAGFTFNHLFASGASLGLSLASAVSEFYLGSGRTAITTLSGNFTQPLLQGFGARNPSVENLTQAERSMIYSVRSFSHNQNSLAVDLVSSYLSLLQRQDSIRNSWASYNRSVTNALRSEALGVDRATRADVDSARQSELQGRNSYIVAVQGYYNSLDAFKTTLGIPIGTDLVLDDSALDQISELGLLPFNIPEETAYIMALTNRLDLLNSIDQFEDSIRSLKNEEDKSKPRLDLTATASMANFGQTNYSDLLDWDINRYRGTAGLQLVLPVDRLSIRTSYRNASIRFEQSIRSLSTQIDNLKRDIRNGINGLNQSRQSYEILLISARLATNQVLNTRLQNEAGDIEFRQVLDAEQSLINAQNAVTDNLVSYTIARLRLLQNMGILRTDMDKFWLQSQLPNADETKTSPTNAPSLSSTALIPPDKLFEK